MSFLTPTYTFFSNFLNHHQLPFCLEMSRLLGNGFRFVATEPIHEDRLAMGYADMNNNYPFIVRSYENTTALCEATRLGNESDVVIIGSAPECFVEKRVLANKLTFRYSERIFKQGRWKIFDPRILRSLIWNHTRFYNKQLYMLCASAYTAGDFALAGAYRGKCFKWGYFPEVREYDLNSLMVRKNGTRLSILWVGRFLELKHPEKALYVSRYLRDHGIDFKLTFIGGGDMDSKLKSIVHCYNLENNVEFLGFLSPEATRKHMEKSEIYLFTSDYNEGWGAVLNEAMNSACAVLCSNAIGSVPFLITHEVNGLIYSNRNIKDLCRKALILARNPELRLYLGNNAYMSMMDIWNAKCSAIRLIKLSESLILDRNQHNLFISGPCSIA
jgi:glycosyltransferase involved in cell wall biosynthesis